MTPVLAAPSFDPASPSPSSVPLSITCDGDGDSAYLYAADDDPLYAGGLIGWFGPGSPYQESLSNIPLQDYFGELEASYQMPMTWVCIDSSDNPTPPSSAGTCDQGDPAKHQNIGDEDCFVSEASYTFGAAEEPATGYEFSVAAPTAAVTGAVTGSLGFFYDNLFGVLVILASIGIVLTLAYMVGRQIGAYRGGSFSKTIGNMRYGTRGNARRYINGWDSWGN